MIFTNKHTDEKLIRIEIEDVMADRVHKCQFLRIIIDSQLTWKSFNENIITVKQIQCYHV